MSTVPARLNLATERIGAGRPQNSAKSKRQLELVRHRGRKALIVGIRRLTQYIFDPKNAVDPFYLSVWAQIADRCGLPKKVNVDGDVSVAMFTPELMREVIRETMIELQSNPSLGRVEPVDAEYSVVETDGAVTNHSTEDRS